MKVSVIIPTRNEAGCIGRVLSEMPREVVAEVIVIDGHSTDSTIEEVRRNMGKKDRLTIQKGRGYGAAFLEGFKMAKGDCIVMMDGDGSHNPNDIKRMLKKIREGYEYVMASRYMKGGKSEDDTLIRWFGNFFFTRLTNWVHGTSLTDSLYLYTAITRRGLNKLNLETKGFEFCTEIVVKAHKAGLKFAEVAAVERLRFAGRSKVNSFYHGLIILRMILRRYD